MPSHPLGDEYRRRAHRLRQLASSIETSSVMQLHHHAGSATWSCPAATTALEALRSHRTSLQRHVGELHGSASWLVRRADELDASLLSTPGPV